ncbi:vanadium-dependent haloperoxidase [Spirosoma profusum]|uniref:vanadium-dependent haloperoxidase n=1 Tax=Spirosoma profusum TaxID=2771354 RepID=UPI00293B9B11|nr:vanadium-dependent haloperoxidase [Spirosoma profusum]
MATAWADMTLHVVKKAKKNSPTYGSRAIGYLGLTMYETVVYAAPGHRSVARKLSPGLSLPKPKRRKSICWELALNAGQAYMLKALYGYTGRIKPIDSLKQYIHDRYATGLKPKDVERSEKFGEAVAIAIFEWSKSDGGHEAYQRNFPYEYKRPRGEGYWIPPYHGQSSSKFPLHPNWGQNRTFSAQNGRLPVPKPFPYSKDTASQYYKHYKEVFERKKILTDEDRTIVMWWSDDPSETYAPPGHSYNLATIAIRKTQADLVKAAETYAKVGMAVADAFVNCWKTKFSFNVERPTTYIRASVDPQTQWNPWEPFFLEPPFPAFYSGHAVQSAATATVLTAMFGDNFAFVDDTHTSRPMLAYQVKNKLPDGAPTSENYTEYMPTFTDHTLIYKARPYKSFWESAKECAESRLLGGIHTRQDNEVGLGEGTKIANNINALRWH